MQFKQKITTTKFLYLSKKLIEMYKKINKNNYYSVSIHEVF